MGTLSTEISLVNRSSDAECMIRLRRSRRAFLRLGSLAPSDFMEPPSDNWTSSKWSGFSATLLPFAKGLEAQFSEADPYVEDITTRCSYCPKGGLITTSCARTAFADAACLAGK